MKIKICLWKGENIFVLESVENILGKGENAGNPAQCPALPQVTGVIIGVYVPFMDACLLKVMWHYSGICFTSTCSTMF